MSTNAKYAPVNAKDDYISQEDISSVIRNPSQSPDSIKNYSGTTRILSLLGAIALVVVALHALATAHAGGNNTIPDIADDPRLKPYQSPENAEYCAEWPLAEDVAGSHLSTVSFELPTTSELLFFLSRGPTAGHLNIIKNPGHSSVQVDVIAQYRTKADLQRTKACYTGHKGENEHGILVWAEPHSPHNTRVNSVSFNITVMLPRGNGEEYKDLSTDLPTFSHKVDDFFDFWSPTSFNIIRLKSSNAPINYGSLVGESAFIQTQDAEVQGFFAGSKSLSVRTSNAPIRSTSMMFPQAQGDENEVHLQTSNAPVDAALILMSEYVEPKLTATIHTSNGELNVTTPRCPLGMNSSFHLDASTTNAPSTVLLHPDYEGTYDIETSMADARMVVVDTDARDPTGKGRQRTVERTSEGRHAQGSVFWSHNGDPSKEGKSRGSVRVRTSNLPVTMYLM